MKYQGLIDVAAATRRQFCRAGAAVLLTALSGLPMASAQVEIPVTDPRMFVRLHITGDGEPTRTIRDAFIATWARADQVALVADEAAFADYELWVQAAETVDGARRIFAVSHVLADAQLASMSPALVDDTRSRALLERTRPYGGSVMRQARLSILDAADVLSWAGEFAAEIEREQVPSTAARRAALVAILTSHPRAGERRRGAEQEL